MLDGMTGNGKRTFIIGAMPGIYMCRFMLDGMPGTGKCTFMMIIIIIIIN